MLVGTANCHVIKIVEETSKASGLDDRTFIGPCHIKKPWNLTMTRSSPYMSSLITCCTEAIDLRLDGRVVLGTGICVSVGSSIF